MEINQKFRSGPLFSEKLNLRVDKGETKRLFPPPSLPCSSVVEQVTVNHLVVGSNPTGAAISPNHRLHSDVFFIYRQRRRIGFESTRWFDEELARERRGGMHCMRATAPKARYRAAANPTEAAISPNHRPQPDGFFRHRKPMDGDLRHYQPRPNLTRIASTQSLAGYFPNLPDQVTVPPAHPTIRAPHPPRRSRLSIDPSS